MTSVLRSCCLLLLVLLAPSAVVPKIFDRCSLALQLRSVGVPRFELPDYVCIANYGSKYNSSDVGHSATSSTRYWGMFHISDEWWCKPETGKSYNMCKLNCEELLNEDLVESVRCAQIIKKRQGFNAWSSWKKYCKTEKPDVEECFE